MGTAATVAAVVHKDEKTIRMWRKEFKDVGASFPKMGEEDTTERPSSTTRSADKMGS